MFTLSRDAAISAVRKNLDEQGLNESAMFGESTDNVSLDDMIAKTLPEAINAVNAAAPAHKLVGKSYTPTNVTVEGRVLSFTLMANVIRVAAFKTADSPVVVTDVIPESSAEGRKQLNKYVRGTFDAPVLVEEQGFSSPRKFKYYSLKEDSSGTGIISRCEFVPVEEYSETKTTYSVSEDLYWAILYQLTAMVLNIYGETEKAAHFYNLSNTQLN